MMFEDIYQQLMGGNSPYEPDLRDILGDDYNDDYEETFITSEELAKATQKPEEKKKFGVPDPGNVEIEEDVYFQRFRRKHRHVYTEKEMEEIRLSCMNTIVHDYGDNDIYHQSDEERAQNDMLAEIGLKLGTLKRTYRKIDQYIEAMRVVVQAWELLEKNNYIHTEKEFFELVAEGKIVSNRILMPKMKRLNMYNMDLVIKYISNPSLDPTDLVEEDTVENDDTFYDRVDISTIPDDAPLDKRMLRYYYEEYLYNLKLEKEDPDYEITNADEQKAEEYAFDEQKKDRMDRLLTPEELEYICENIDNPPAMKVSDIKRRYIDGYDDRSISRKLKKMKKRDRYIAKNLHTVLNKIQSNPAFRRDEGYGQSYLITHSMFEKPREPKDIFDDLYYTGSWADEEMVKLYDFITREELLKQHPPRESYLTYADKEQANFFKILESEGVYTVELRRLMNCTTEELNYKEAKHVKRENKKREARVLQRVMQLQDDPGFKKLCDKAEKTLNDYNEGKYDV